MYFLQVADRAFDGIIIMKFLPLWLVKILISTGLYRIFFKCFKYTEKTLQQVLDELTNDQDLKATLSYICGDYGIGRVIQGFYLPVHVTSLWVKG
jgi:all-trans-retinol 13,14-reductase